jgi:hypothetical protein
MEKKIFDASRYLTHDLVKPSQGYVDRSAPCWASTLTDDYANELIGIWGFLLHLRGALTKPKESLKAAEVSWLRTAQKRRKIGSYRERLAYLKINQNDKKRGIPECTYYIDKLDALVKKYNDQLDAAEADPYQLLDTGLEILDLLKRVGSGHPHKKS